MYSKTEIYGGMIIILCIVLAAWNDKAYNEAFNQCMQVSSYDTCMANIK